MSTALEVARQEWAEGHRRVEGERANAARYRLLHTQLDAVVEQLRRRLGTTFTLIELVAEYRRAESWVGNALAELPPSAQWVAGATTATDAAFHLYARGAQDYKP